MKKLQFIQVVPNDLRFWWETFVQLRNFRKYGYSELANVIIFIPKNELNTGPITEWGELEYLFPETKFYYVFDTEHGRTERLIKGFDYIPVLRLTCLEHFFTLSPDLHKDSAFFYHDSDILFTKKLDFSPFLKDEICYLSDTKSYINSDYFDGKVNDVLPEKKEAFLKEDVLNKCAKICNTTREICVANKNRSGGAQYLLKGKALTGQFWTDVLNNCLELRVYLQNVNNRYFPGSTSTEKENKGIQRWCSDMFSLLFNLWSHGLETATPKEFDFAWATDETSRLEEVHIYHNAGITSDSKLKRKVDKVEVEIPAFYKGAPQYVSNQKTPFHDEEQEYLDAVVKHPMSKLYGTAWYAQQIKDTKKEFNL